MTDGQHNALFSSVLTACKVHHLCGRCGRIRAPKTALSPNQKNCPPPQGTQECINNTCTHNLYTQPSLWRSEEFTLHMKPYLLEYH